MIEQFGERFATPDEVRNISAEVDLDNDVNSGAGLPLLSDGRKVNVCDDDTHSLIIGGSGSKKNRLIIFPLIYLLAMRNENLFISDPKGETFARTGSFLKKCGYNIKVLDYRHVGKRGDFYNPLAFGYKLYKDGYQDEAQEIFADFVNTIAAPQKKTTNDIFWAESASSLAIGVLNILAECAEKEEANVASFARMCSHDNADRLEALADMIPQDSIAGINLKGIKTAPKKTKMSIYISLFAMVSMFISQKNLINSLSTSTFNLEELTNPKTAIFIITPDEKDTYNFIISLMVKQAYQILIAKAQENKNLKLDVRVNFVLDEFPNIPEIPDFTSMISAGRSRNIRFFLVTQSLHQLQTKYGEYETQTIIGNCSNIVYLHSRELPLLEMLSNLCGKRYLSDGTAIPLITPSQLQRLSKEKGEVLIFCGRLHPYVTCLPDIDQYGKFKGYPSMEVPLANPKKARIISITKIIDDINNGIRPRPFVEKKRAYTSRLRKKPIIEENDDIQSELERKFKELFGDDA